MNCASKAKLVVTFLFASSFVWASGASLYKTKCAGCHGPTGAGKPAMKAPPLKGTSLDENELTSQITKGKSESKAPHNKPISGVNEAQAKAIAEYIKALK